MEPGLLVVSIATPVFDSRLSESAAVASLKMLSVSFRRLLN